MTDLIGWAIYGIAQAGPWLLTPLAIATGWTLYRLAHRARRRTAARRAEPAARPDTDEIAALEQLYRLPDATRRNTRKENQ